MPPVLTLSFVQEDGSTFSADYAAGPVTIGRETENTLAIDATSVSRSHGSIALNGKHWLYRDLGSTNGSWHNGLRLVPGQKRLLRHGDSLQIAGVTLSVSFAGGATETGPASLLIFSGEKFQGEFPFEDPQAIFVVGGPEGDVGAQDDDLSAAEQFRIVHSTGNLEARIAANAAIVTVNGAAAGGPIVVVDCDEISASRYRVFINDPATAAREADVRSRAQASQQASASHPGKGTAIRNRPEGSYALGQNIRGWDSTEPERTGAPPKRFVFGRQGDEDDGGTTSTLAMPAEAARGSSAFDVGVGRRFGSLAAYEEEPVNRAGSKTVLILIIILLVLIGSLAGLVAYLFLE